MNGSFNEPALHVSQFNYEAFEKSYFKTVLADLRGIIATKTSMVWQLDCNSTLVRSETRRPSLLGYASRKALDGRDGFVVELDGEYIQELGRYINYLRGADSKNDCL